MSEACKILYLSISLTFVIPIFFLIFFFNILNIFSLFILVSFFVLFSFGQSKSKGKMAAVEITGPAKGPFPTSSTPIIKLEIFLSSRILNTNFHQQFFVLIFLNLPMKLFFDLAV